MRFAPGRYVTGALFLRSGIHLGVDSGVTLLGSADDADYPTLPTRVAGIEMPWPAALIDVNDARGVRISGRGTIDGRGQKWWDKYWKMRREDYEPRGLRWAVDYDAERVRLVVVARSSDVTIEQVHLRRSGVWTLRLPYANHVTVDGITIADNGGPSTDGVDITRRARQPPHGHDGGHRLEAGAHARGWTMTNVRLATASGAPVTLVDAETDGTPTVVRR